MLSSSLVVYSDDADELEKKLNEAQQQKLLKEKILTDTQQELNSILNNSWSLAQKIAAIEDQISKLETDIANSQKEIEDKDTNIKSHESQIGDKQVQIVEISGRLYKNSRLPSFEFLFKTEESGEILRTYILKKYTLVKQVESIEMLNYELGDLEEKRKLLEEEKVKLEAENEALGESKKVLATKKEELQKQVAAATAARGQLKNEITLLNNTISDLQKAILMARSGSFVPSVGSVPSGADYNASAEGFRKNAPSGAFAVFSFGAYTHRKGMSQYGAYGRAMQGQNSDQILTHYFGKTPIVRDTSGNISVIGYGGMDFETTYLYGLAEMPSNWHPEALKAQAIVARSYAYRYKRDGISICTTQSCQVFLKSKSDNPPAEWKAAVDATRGKIIEGVTTYYSSTTGGYLIDSGWDTTDGAGGGNWTERAYESIAGSPWFYKAWHRNGLNMSASSCGREPWMSEAEMIDIINTWLVMKRNGVVGNVTDSRILPITVNSCPYPGGSGTPYSMAEMSSLLSNPVTSISGYPSVSFTTNGQTGAVSFSTNRGIISISGADFKAVFNTRAPAYLSIPQSSWAGDFTFINVERKL